jgi:hypothetical protein
MMARTSPITITANQMGISRRIVFASYFRPSLSIAAMMSSLPKQMCCRITTNLYCIHPPPASVIDDRQFLRLKRPTSFAILDGIFVTFPKDKSAVGQSSN